MAIEALHFKKKSHQPRASLTVDHVGLNLILLDSEQAYFDLVGLHLITFDLIGLHLTFSDFEKL